MKYWKLWVFEKSKFFKIFIIMGDRQRYVNVYHYFYQKKIKRKWKWEKSSQFLKVTKEKKWLKSAPNFIFKLVGPWLLAAKGMDRNWPFRLVPGIGWPPMSGAGNQGSKQKKTKYSLAFLPHLFKFFKFGNFWNANGARFNASIAFLNWTTQNRQHSPHFVILSHF